MQEAMIVEIEAGAPGICVSVDDGFFLASPTPLRIKDPRMVELLLGVANGLGIDN